MAQADAFYQQQPVQEVARVAALDAAWDASQNDGAARRTAADGNDDENDAEFQEALRISAAATTTTTASTIDELLADAERVQAQGGGTQPLTLADALRRMAPQQTGAATGAVTPIRAHLSSLPNITELQQLLQPVRDAVDAIRANLTSLDALFAGDDAALLSQMFRASAALLGDGVFSRADLSFTDTQASMRQFVIENVKPAGMAYAYQSSPVTPLLLDGMIERCVSTVQRGITAEQSEPVRTLYSKAWTLASTMHAEGNKRGIQAMFDAIVGNCREGRVNSADQVNRVFMAYVDMLDNL